MSNLSLRMDQNTILIDLLRASDFIDQESLLQNMMLKAKVSRELADAYLRSWMFNHKEGAIGAIAGAVDKHNGASTIVSPQDGPKLFIQTKSSNLPPAPNMAGGGLIAQILNLHIQGFSNREIIEKGYNKSTVSRQVSEHKKREAAKKLENA